MTSNRKAGDEAEKFVAFDVLLPLKFLVEIHPRTFRLIHFARNKTIQISQDNDYYNLFDIKAERHDFMIYVQVKYEERKNHASEAQKSIDVAYPYEFPYQRLQTWQVWKEWVKPEKGRRHKEYRYRIQERRGFTKKTWKDEGVLYPKGNWVDVQIAELYDTQPRILPGAFRNSYSENIKYEADE